MPQAGPRRTASIFLGDRQASKFSNPVATGTHVEDKLSVQREIYEGLTDADEQNFGLFEGGRLIASLSLVSPAMADTDCPSVFWSVGMIEVSHDHQGKGLGPGLLDAVFYSCGQPLASDLDQDGGGADLWKRWIRDHPGDIELHDPSGACLGVVTEVDGQYAPNPWATRNTRLVRMP